MIVRVRLKGAQEALLAIARVRRKIRSGSIRALGRQLTKEGLRTLQELTPRSRQRNRAPSTKRGYPPLRKQWESIERSVSETRYVAVLRSRAMRNRRGVVVLASVETGAKPHRIPGRGFRRMVWDESSSIRLFKGRMGTADPLVGRGVADVFGNREARAGGPVIAYKVNHPGMRGFHMLDETAKHMQSAADFLLRQYAAEIEQEWLGLKVSFTTR